MKIIQNAEIRKFLKFLLPAVILPAFAVASALINQNKGIYLFITVFAAFTVLLFISGMESKIEGGRRAVLVSVFVALAVVGRFIPLIKPMFSIVIIAGIYLGAESGFITGAFTLLISDFYFGLGAWTPFQMLAAGLIGLFAGIFSQRLGKSRILTVVYGVFSGILYSLLMDIWSIMGIYGGFEFSSYLEKIYFAIPTTLLYAASNGLFIWIFYDFFGRKLRRIKKKYGI